MDKNDHLEGFITTNTEVIFEDLELLDMLIPFCGYNLTSTEGKTLFRRRGLERQ